MACTASTTGARSSRAAPSPTTTPRPRSGSTAWALIAYVDDGQPPRRALLEPRLLRAPPERDRLDRDRLRLAGDRRRRPPRWSSYLDSANADLAGRPLRRRALVRASTATTPASTPATSALHLADDRLRRPRPRSATARDRRRPERRPLLERRLLERQRRDRSTASGIEGEYSAITLGVDGLGVISYYDGAGGTQDPEGRALRRRRLHDLGLSRSRSTRPARSAGAPRSRSAPTASRSSATATSTGAPGQGPALPERLLRRRTCAVAEHVQRAVLPSPSILKTAAEQVLRPRRSRSMPGPFCIERGSLGVEIEIGRGKKARQAYGFDDIAIVPSQAHARPAGRRTSAGSSARTCSSCRCSASAMDGVVSPKIAIELGKLGGLGVLNLEGIFTRYEAAGPRARRRSPSLPKEQATRGMQEIYAKPVEPELIASADRARSRTRACSAAGVADAAEGPRPLRGRARGRARRPRDPGHGRLGRARLLERPRAQPEGVHLARCRSR